MDETILTEELDRRGLLDASHSPGTYALRVSVPDSAEQVAREWLAIHDAPLPDDYQTRLAAAQRVLYVGASGDIYDRLSDHATKRARQSAFLRAFPPVELVDVWPTMSAETAFHDEYNRARDLSDADTRVWTDGDLL